MAAQTTTGLARMRRVPRRSTDSMESSQSEKPPSVLSLSSIPQIVEASIRSIPQRAFMHNLSTTGSSTKTTEPVNNGSLPTDGTLTILTMNKELSILPVDAPVPPKGPSDNDVQFVRCAKAVATQTAIVSEKHKLDDPAESQQPKRSRISHSLDYSDQPDLLRRLVQLKEERLAVEKEKLKTLRQLVSCLRGANGSTSVLATVLGEK